MAPAAIANQPNGGMANMSGHMVMTTLRPLRDGDRQKADSLVVTSPATTA